MRPFSADVFRRFLPLLVVMVPTLALAAAEPYSGPLSLRTGW
jgi:hypothetical protein